MTTHTNNTLVWRAKTEAENYAWISKISAGLDAVGLVKHTDTGQIVLAGVSAIALPASPSNQYKECGYEIRKMVAAGRPTVFFRIGYGVASSGNGSGGVGDSYCPVVRMQFSDQTDGAGNLGSVRSAAMMSCTGYYPASENPPISMRPFYFASDGANYLTMVIDPSLIASASPANALPLLQWCVERSIDPDTGAYDSDGMVYVRAENGDAPSGGDTYPFTKNSVNYGILNFASGQSAYVASATPTQASSLWNISGVAGVTPIFPITVMLPKIKGPMLNCMGYYKDDLVSNSVFQATVYGEMRTYRTASSQTSNSHMTPLASVLRAAFRFD